jgi:hypothetical protein
MGAEKEGHHTIQSGRRTDSVKDGSKTKVSVLGRTSFELASQVLFLYAESATNRLANNQADPIERGLKFGIS